MQEKRGQIFSTLPTIPPSSPNYIQIMLLPPLRCALLYFNANPIVQAPETKDKNGMWYVNTPKTPGSICLCSFLSSMVIRKKEEDNKGRRSKLNPSGPSPGSRQDAPILFNRLV